jgi:predicted PurR-regulated permease PerM
MRPADTVLRNLSVPDQRRIYTLADPFKLTILIFTIITFMYFAGEVLKPLALSVLLSFSLAPGVRLLERLGLPRVAAVVMTVLITLGLLAVIGYVVGQQLTSLANRLPDYQQNIETKLRGVIKPEQESTTDRLKNMAEQVTAKMEKPPSSGSSGEVPIQKVEVVTQPWFQERLRSSLGPYLELLGIGSFVLVLVLFMLLGREDLSDRIVGLFGHRQVTLTTRTMQEIGQRISRYLAMFAVVNSCFGLVIGLGLGLIGVPFAVLWGCLAAMLRFIPYVGPAVAFVLPLTFSFAHFPGWVQPLEVVALFGAVEIALNSFLEPVIYGKTTGVTALGLLVAAMFWTWLWGTLGLLLSTPLTVCLAVLGKYVPSLWFFATILGEEVELRPDVRLYQRLVALDREKAFEVIEKELKEKPQIEVFDQVLVPVLSRAERDTARSELGDTERDFVWSVVGEILDKLGAMPDPSPSSPADLAEGDHELNGSVPAMSPVPLVGLAVQGTSDALVLRMLGQLLSSSGCVLEIITDTDSSLQVTERVSEHSPKLVVMSVLPREGLSLGRYLLRQLRTRFGDIPIVVGRWGGSDEIAGDAPRLVELGASDVVGTLADARARVLKLAILEQKKETMASAVRA